MVKHILLEIFYHIDQNWPKLTLKLFQCNNPFFKECSRTWTWEDSSITIRIKTIQIFLAIFWHMNLKLIISLCSRNFQNMKLRLDFVENLIILLPLQFYVKSNFSELKRSKNVVFGNFRSSEFWFLVNLSNFQVPNLPKFKVQSFWNCKNNIIGPFEFPKIWFHIKPEWK